MPSAKDAPPALVSVGVEANIGGGGLKVADRESEATPPRRGAAGREGR